MIDEQDKDNDLPSIIATFQTVDGTMYDYGPSSYVEVLDQIIFNGDSLISWEQIMH